MKKLIMCIVLIFISNGVYAQLNEPDYLDIGASRNPNSAQTGLNLGSGSWTNFQLVTKDMND